MAKITIEFVNNREKAGKLTLIDNDGVKILNKVPVAIPEEDGNIINLPHTSRVSTQDIVSEVKYSGTSDEELSYEYSHALSKIFKMAGNSVIESSKGGLLFYGQPENGTILNNDKNALVLKQADYEKLKNTIIKSNDFISARVELNIKNVMFLWSPEEVKRSGNSLVDSFDRLSGIKYEIQHFEEVKKSEMKVAAQEKARSDSIEQSTKNKVVEKPITEKNISPNVAKPVTRVKKTTTTTQSDDDLDAFDVMFMYNYPDLAPMYKPNSMLAWYMYFNENEVSRENVQNNINNIAGFEQVSATDLKYTTTGYNVKLFDDSGDLMGTLNCSNGNYSLDSPNGQSTILEKEGSRMSGCVVSNDNSQTTFDFVPSPDGFIGNWSNTSDNGVSVSSGIVLDNDFAPSSTPYKTNDLDTQSSPSMSNDYQMHSAPAADSSLNYTESSNPSFDYAPSKDLDNSWDNKYEPPPPPPPPPPKNDDYSWSSSADSYSNGASFGM